MSIETTTEPKRSYSTSKVLLLAISSNGLATGLSFVYALVSTGVLYRYFGPSRFGVWSTIFSLTFAFGFLNLGVGNATLNETAAAFHKGRRSVAASLVLSALILSAGTMVLLLVAGYAFLEVAGVHSVFRDLPPSSAAEARGLFVAFLLLFSFGFPSSVLTQSLRGLQQPWKANLCNGIGQVLSIAGVFLGAHLRLPMNGLLLLTYGVQVGAQLLIPAWILWRQFRGVRGIKLARIRLFTLRVSRVGLSFFTLQISWTFAFFLDYVLVSRFAGTTAAATFAIIQRLFQIVLAGNAVITSQLWSVFAYLFASRQIDKLKRLFFISLTGIMAFGTVVSAVIWLFRIPITQAWVGAPLTGLGLACALYAIYNCMQLAGGLLSNLMNAAGIITQQVLPGVVFAASAFLLKVYWLPDYGINGLIAGALCGYTLSFVALYVLAGKSIRGLFRPAGVVR